MFSNYSCFHYISNIYPKLTKHILHLPLLCLNWLNISWFIFISWWNESVQTSLMQIVSLVFVQSEFRICFIIFISHGFSQHHLCSVAQKPNYWHLEWFHLLHCHQIYLRHLPAFHWLQLVFFVCSGELHVCSGSMTPRHLSAPNPPNTQTSSRVPENTAFTSPVCRRLFKPA